LEYKTNAVVRESLLHASSENGFIEGLAGHSLVSYIKIIDGR
jgi:hypothetical protein